MYAPRVPFSFRSRNTIAAVAVAMALIALAPSGAEAGLAARQISHGSSATTDISSARRHHAHHSRTATRAAYGSFIDRPVYGYPAYHDGGYPGYGYGIGDNSNSYTN
jgi:hypothetical protein